VQAAHSSGSILPNVPAHLLIAQEAVQTSTLRYGGLLIVTLCLLLGLFMAILIVLAVHRFTQPPRPPRTASDDEGDDDPGPDPWQEAGRRLQIQTPDGPEDSA
jgi:hypothetical protein